MSNVTDLMDPNTPASFDPSLGVMTDPTLGLPTSDGTSANATINLPNPDGNTSAVVGPAAGQSFFSKVSTQTENAAGGLITSVENGVKDAYGAGKSVVGVVATDVASGFGYVADTASDVVKRDIIAPVEGVLGFGLGATLLLVAGLGIALYFMGKSGALKINAIV